MRLGLGIALGGAAAVAVATGRPYAEAMVPEGLYEFTTDELLEGGRMTAVWLATAVAAVAALAGIVRPPPEGPAGAAVFAAGILVAAVAIAHLTNPLLLYFDLAVDPDRRSGAFLLAAGSIAILAGGAASWEAERRRRGGQIRLLLRPSLGHGLAAAGALALLVLLFVRWTGFPGAPGFDQGGLSLVVFAAAILAALANHLWAAAGGEDIGGDVAVGLLGGAGAIVVAQIVLEAPGGFGEATVAQWAALGACAAIGAGGYAEWRRTH